MCDCVDNINLTLDDYDTEIEVYPVVIPGTSFVYETVYIKTKPTKLNGRAKPVIANYCPFCGEKWGER